MDFDRDLIIRELHFKTARSGGKGGQHVNKVSSKVWLGWEIGRSQAVSEEQKLLWCPDYKRGSIRMASYILRLPKIVVKYGTKPLWWSGFSV